VIRCCQVRGFERPGEKMDMTAGQAMADGGSAGSVRSLTPPKRQPGVAVASGIRPSFLKTDSFHSTLKPR
jgi:hypothetical protein